MTLDVMQTLAAARILPVIVTGDVPSAGLLGAALSRGGLRVAEVTFRTPDAALVLRAMADDPTMLIGAGTIIATEQVDHALAAGARFIVSPGFDLRIVEHCRDRGVPVFPGVATATELQAAVAAGLTAVKLFPAEQLGGVSMISALSAPFGRVRFIPTGGIGVDQLAGYLAHPAVLAVGGSWMAPNRLIAAGAWDEIASRTAHAVSLATRDPIVAG